MAQGLLPACQSLTGQTVHQIQGQVPEARLADPLDGGDHLGVIVGTAQFFQQLVVIRLHPQAHPVEALAPETAQELVRNGVGVGIKGDLRVGGHVEAAADGGHNGSHAVGTEKAGGAAAEVDGVHLVAGSQGARFLDVGAYGV